MFAQIQKPPNELIECSDTLPKCFFKAFLARKAVLNRNGFSYDNVYSVCNSSTVLLQESLKSRNVKGMNAVSLIIFIIKGKKFDSKSSGAL